MKVKFLDLSAQYRSIKAEIDSAVKSVVESGNYILGENVSAFERETASWLGAAYCAGVASGTDAIILALKACGAGPGDSVITTPFTFTASVESVLRCGAEPVLCDIEPDTFNIDVSKIEGVIRKNTRVILPVHLYGHPADMNGIMDIADARGLMVVEDAAQAFGAGYKGKKVGALGDAGAFSFFPSKTLGAFGDAGMAAAGDRRLYEKIKLLRTHGLKDGECVESGFNSRLDEIQAAVLRVKLKHADEWIEKRRSAARLYYELLEGSGVTCPAVREYARHSFNYYVIKCDRRDELREYLALEGIETGVYYPMPVHLHKAFRALGHREGDFPAAEESCGKVLALPIYPEITPEEQACVAGRIKDFYGG